MLLSEHQLVRDELLNQSGNRTVRHQQMPGQLGHCQTVLKAIQLRQHVEPRQRRAEVAAQTRLEHVLDARRAGQQAQPDPDLDVLRATLVMILARQALAREAEARWLPERASSAADRRGSTS